MNLGIKTVEFFAVALLSLKMDVQKIHLGVFFIANNREENDEPQK